MIIDNQVKTCVAGGNIKHLKSLDYNVKNGDIINIPVEHLSKNSHVKINCRCDICGSERKMTYQCYISLIKYDGKYYCCNCMKNKRKKILMEKYGVENVFQLKSSINKADETRMKKYGNPKYRNDDKIKETNLIKYGCENVFQNEEIKNKIFNDNIKKYGVGYLSQDPKMYAKKLLISKKIKKYNDNLYYQSSYEKDFINFCQNNGVLEYISKPKKAIEYAFKNKKCYYHPDFYIKSLNLLIEIKSDYWWNKLLEINLIKEKSVKDQDFNYIVIMNKNYLEFQNAIDKLNFQVK